jgi:hypothetical protein
MAKPSGRAGAIVQYCGHDGCFVADIYEVAGAYAVYANGPVTPANIVRDGRLGRPTYHLLDFPTAGCWKPERGIFVVPKEQCKPIQQAREGY